MHPSLPSLPRIPVHLDAGTSLGPLETWRHTLGHGGINTTPLPAKVVEGTRKLHPRLIRIFLQECFAFYPAHGRFDWSRLDPYMESFARTGSQLVAAINFKPPVLYPQVDQTIWQPNDVGEWQNVVSELVRRYSVEKPLVTYWEIGNETDIGEHGGCPYLIQDPDDYLAYYRMTTQAILDVFPTAKVGGPAAAGVSNEPLPGLIERCRQTGTQLDFVSWHLYSDNYHGHVTGVEKVKAALQDYPGKRPEMLVTEWNNSFPPVSLEEITFEPRRAANLATSLLAMRDAGLDWSFHYHLWDQVFYPEDFRAFFSPRGLAGMAEHWNEIPHRMGLFGVGEEVRPQYFVYWMLNRLGEEQIAAHTEEPDLRVLAGHRDGGVAAMLVNFNLQSARDLVATVHFTNLTPGSKTLTTYRIDDQRRWSDETQEMLPVERREVYTAEVFRCQVYCPADSVLLLTLK